MELADAIQVFLEADGGLSKLRDLLVDLAVSGQLQTQSPSDSSSNAVLMTARSERAQQIATKSISKKRGTYGDLPPQAQPFAIPGSWVWGRIADVGYDLGQTKPTARFTYIDVTSIDPKRGTIAGSPAVLDASEAPSRARKLVAPGAVIYSTVRPYLLNIAVIEHDYSPAPIASTAFSVISPYSGIDARYLYYWLRSSSFVEYVEAEMKGMAYPAINDAKFLAGPAPIPPPEEQMRIVELLEKLLAHCDELEAKQEKKRLALTRLNEACLDRLLTAQTPDEFAEHWQRIHDNFDLMYDQPELVSPLRDAIRDLAVSGRLHCGECSMSPKPVLDRAFARLQELRAAKKLRGNKEIEPMTHEAALFDAPSHWTWERFGLLADIGGGVTKGRKLKKREAAMFPYLRVANVQRGYLDLREIKEIELPLDELEKYSLRQGDILLTEGGDWDKLGRSAIWTGEIEPCLHQNHIFRARPLDGGLRARWITLLTNSPIGRRYFADASKQTTNLASINMTQLRALPVPVPPTKEQDEILARLEALLELCDRLEDALRNREQCAAALFAALATRIATTSGIAPEPPRSSDKRPQQLELVV